MAIIPGTRKSGGQDGTQLYWTESITVSQDIKEGAMVKATYEPAQDGKLVLSKIEIVTK